MKVIFVGDEFPARNEAGRVPNSIFLAGPTPRSDDVQSWRPGVLKRLEASGFDGSVFVPETADWGWLGDYDRQVRWEWEALGCAGVTLFWVPRDLKTMPGMTTNVEFGFMAAIRPRSTVLGAPRNAPKTRYLMTLAKERGYEFGRHFGLEVVPPIPVADNLEDAVALCATILTREKS